ncbi:MAG: N-acetyltransferase [Gammaproteobacteria bacterium]|nr:N-acetyltransferase [Gammaproteobacteria bacterium]
MQIENREITLSDGQTALVRPARTQDVEAMHKLLAYYASQGNLLPRSTADLYHHLRDFYLVEIAGEVAATAGLEIFTAELGEVRSLVVDPGFQRHGLGRHLCLRLIEEARAIGLSRLMALTYVPDFFHNLGFRTVEIATLPEKVMNVCRACYKFNRCDEIAVILNLNSVQQSSS